MNRGLWAISAVWLLGCHDTTGGTEAGPPSQYQIRSEPGRADTAAAEPAAPLLLEVQDASGQPVANAQVDFEALVPIANPDGPHLTLGDFSTGARTDRLTDISDAQGRTGVFIRFGIAPGPARLVVRLHDHPADTLTYTILPGGPAVLHLEPRDTALYTAGALTPRIVVRDRFQNPLALTVDLSVEQAGVASVNGGRIIGGATLGTTRVIGRVGTVADTVLVTTAPRGTIAGALGDRIVSMNLDGSGVRTLTSTPNGFGLTWLSADDVAFATPVGAVQELVRVGPTGAVSKIVAIPGPRVTGARWPTATTNGAWVYFNGITSSTSWNVWRVHPNGDALESLDVPSQSGEAWTPAVSPDGNRVAFGTSNSTDGEVRVFDLTTRTIAPWAVRGGMPAWSPKGDLIAYVDGAARVIRVIKPDGTGGRAFARPAGVDRVAPTWSPDGVWILTRRDDRFELINTQSGGVVSLPFGAGAPSWRP